MKTKILICTFVGLLTLVSLEIYRKSLETKVVNPEVQQFVEKETPFVLGNFTLSKEEAKETIKEADLKKHVYWLADDEREGRMSGKRGNVDAATYIYDHFKSYGLETKFQKFMIKRVNPGPKNEVGDDFTSNIIGILRGKTDSAIVTGGHMDHIGYGPSMSMAPGRREIHNGADDNASGAATVLELAEAFSQMSQPKHTLIFICFSAEEMGLIGSQYYVRNPVLPLSSTVCMFNFDMVGYYRGKLYAYGANSVPGMRQIMEKENFPNLVTGGGSGGSDHASFGNRGVPNVFFHTGGHPYYHTPDDDANRINYDGMEKVARFAFCVIEDFDRTNSGRQAKVTFDHLNETHDHGITKFKTK